MQNCSCCFEDWIGPCNGVYDSVTINTSLTPGGAYHWRITDKFQKIYQGDVTAEDDGKIIIPCSELPDFLFTAFSGTFTIEILDAGCKPIKFMLASEYDCITMSINGGNSDKRSIGCEFSTEPPTPSSNFSFPFSDTDGIIIPASSFPGIVSPSVQVYIQTSPSIFELTTVSTEIVNDGNNNIDYVAIDFGGNATGFVIIS